MRLLCICGVITILFISTYLCISVALLFYYSQNLQVPLLVLFGLFYFSNGFVKDKKFICRHLGTCDDIFLMKIKDV